MFVVVSDRLWSPSAPKRCQSSPVLQGRSSISLARLQTSYFADHFPSALGPLLKSWLAFISSTPLDGPPTFRRPMWPGFYRHHLIGLVGVVVGHFPSLSHDHP
jgi:hypothetical protein